MELSKFLLTHKYNIIDNKTLKSLQIFTTSFTFCIDSIINHLEICKAPKKNYTPPKLEKSKRKNPIENLGENLHQHKRKIRVKGELSHSPIALRKLTSILLDHTNFTSTLSFLSIQVFPKEP